MYLPAYMGSVVVVYISSIAHAFENFVVHRQYVEVTKHNYTVRTMLVVHAYCVLLRDTEFANTSANDCD